jgi:hypothetical protein
MEFGRLQLTYAMGLIVTICGLGCAESSGYTDYADLPHAAVDTTAVDPDASQIATGVDGTVEPASIDSTTEKPSADQSSPPEATLADVTPVPAVYGKTEQGGVKPDAPREIKLLIKDKKFPTIKDSDAVRVSYDDLDLEKILNIIRPPTNIADHFPDWLKQLDGKKIRMRGFMWPPFKAEGLTSFVFTRDTGECCFGPDPYIFLRAKVKLADGEKTDFIQLTPFDVEGTFRIAPLADDDNKLWQLYLIDDAKVLVQ